MPTYENNQEIVSILLGPHGEEFAVGAGDTIEVPFFISNENFTKTLDTPISSRSTATTSVDLTSSAMDHDLNAATRRFIVIQITGSVTVRPQLDTAVPILLSWTSENPIFTFALDDYPCEKLRVSGSGACTVMEFAY